MRGLYYAAHRGDVRCMQYIMQLHRRTAVVADTPKAVCHLLAENKFDVLWLDYGHASFITRYRLTAIARKARKLHPDCLIILCRRYPGFILDTLRETSKGLFDLSVHNYCEANALAACITLIVSRRRERTHPPQKVPYTKGAIYGPYAENNYMLHKHLHTAGLDTVVSEDIDCMERALDTLQPDLVITHCHSSKGEFARIKQFCERVRKRLPSCTLLVTCYVSSVAEYNKSGGLDTFPYDLLIEPGIGYAELVAVLWELGERKEEDRGN